MQQISEHVFTDTTFRGCNPSIILTREGAVCIDTAQLISKLMEFRSFALAHGPIRLLINTESHIDHIFGNHWFAEDCPCVGHENLPGRFLKNLPFDYYDYSRDIIARQDPEALHLMPPREAYICYEPTITFRDKLNLHIGDTRLELYYTPGHTDANICVFYPDEGVLFTGDTVFSQCQTWFNGANPGQLLDSLRFLKTLDFHTLVPGHGPVSDKQELDRQIAFVYEWISAVGHGIAQGWTLAECEERISFADRFPVDIGQEEVLHPIQKVNVRNIFNYLTAR